MTYIYNPSYMGGMGSRITVCGWPMAKSARFYLKNNESIKGPVTGAPAWKSMSPELKPQY
jgi:hypothetical protein